MVEADYPVRFARGIALSLAIAGALHAGCTADNPGYLTGDLLLSSSLDGAMMSPLERTDSSIGAIDLAIPSMTCGAVTQPCCANNACSDGLNCAGGVCVSTCGGNS